MSDSGGPSKRMRYCDQVQEPELLEELCDIDVDSLGSSSDNSAVVDESFFDAETVILEWDFPLFEAVDTDRCAKVRFSDEIPEEVLEAHLRHHTSGERGISPAVRYWCMRKFSELYPGAPCSDFDLV
jgi:hypothetical protein